MYRKVLLPGGGVWLKPHEDNARQAIFRAAWNTLILSPCGKYVESGICLHCAAIATMQDQQPYLGAGPDDPEWIGFIETLPGYREYWERVLAEDEEEQAKAEVDEELC